MSVASTVSRLPITVKVVPVSTSEEERDGQLQKQAERDEHGPQARRGQHAQAEQESRQEGKLKKR